MKKLLFLMSLCLCINSQAADIYVNSSGQAGSYPTLAGALAAANNGDRILVSNIITLTETDTINKSVTIISTAPGDQFELIGDLYVEAVAGLEIRIIGLKQTGDIYCFSGTANGTNGCNLYIIDSEISGDVNCDISGLILNLLYSNLNDNIVIFRDGKLIANQIGGFYIAAGDNVNYNDTILIVANKIYGGTISDITQNNPIFECSYIDVGTYANNFLSSPNCQNAINTNDHFFFIANNYFYSLNNNHCQLFLRTTNSSSNGTNTIINNTFRGSDIPWGGSISTLATKNSSGKIITFYYLNSHANTKLVNNIGFGKGSNGSSWNSIFAPALGTGNDNGNYSSYSLEIDSNYLPTFEYNHFGSTGAPSSSGSNYFSSGVSGNIIAVNGFDVFKLSNTAFVNTNGFNLYIDNGKAFSGTDATNAGKNSIDYYDIDMTRNDLGTYGGPYSWDNYWNTASGSARIYNLDLPFEIWSGQPNVKADAVHQK